MDPIDCSSVTGVSRLLELPDELKLEVIQHVSWTATLADFVIIDLIDSPTSRPLESVPDVSGTCGCCHVKALR